MNIKDRSKPGELKLLESLQKRVGLSEEDRNILTSLQKGYEGEVKFDVEMEIISKDWIFINDLLLKYKNTLFQIDSLLLAPDRIYLFEIKNFDGDYYIDNGRWYTFSKKEINDPMFQLRRSESLFRRLLQDLGVKVALEPYISFINSEFQLYQAPLNLPIIFLPQLPRFIKMLNENTSKMPASHLRLAEKLVDLHIIDNPYKRIPEFKYEQLTKGIYCRHCNLFLNVTDGDLIICKQCGVQEKTGEAVLRTVEEYRLLFPERKITTLDLYEWCGRIPSKRSIRRILQKTFTMVGAKRHSYFIDESSIK